MSKALRTAGTVITIAAGVALAAVTAGASLGISAAALGGIQAVGGLIAAVGTALQKPEIASGNPTDWVADPDAPIPFAFGRVGAAGNIVHRTTFGPDLMYEGFVTVLSGGGPINSFVGFTGDDQSVTFDGAGKANSSQWTGEMWMKTSLGSQPASALVSPSGLKNSAVLPAWGIGYALSGKAAYMLVLGENSKRTAYPTGEPKPLWVIEGLKLWDPRLDSTYPGGSGSCRLNTPSTWVYSTNPILCGLKWALGLWEGPTGQGAPGVDYQVGGIGAKVEGIDVPAFVSAANIADANSWSVAAYPTSDDDKAQVLDGFLQAGGAIYAQKAGRVSCIQRAAPRTSIVTISATDTAGPMEFDTAASRINRINTLRPRFWSEANRWQMTAIDEVTSSTYQTEDGGKRTRGIDFPFVPGQVQCGQLAALQIAHTREGITGTIPLKPHLQRIAPGDAFTITEAGFVLNALKCLCLNTEYDPATGVHRVTFVSETDAKYAFALGQSPDAPESPTLTPVITSYVEPPASGDWTITVRATAANGTRVPAFDLVGAVSNATATGLLVEWGLISDSSDAGNWTMAYEGPASATSVPITGMNAGAALYVAVSHRRGQNISARTLYGPLTAGGLIGTNDAAILAALDRIASDGWLTRGEKPEVIRQHGSINGEYAGLAAQGSALGLSTQVTAYFDAVTALNTYLAGLTPAWNDTASDTSIVGTTFRSKFVGALVAKQALMDAMYGDLGADVTAALSRLDVIASDSILSAGEKGEVIRQHGAINGEYAGLAAQGSALGLSTQVTAYFDAVTALNTYLAGLSPAWNDTASDTPIVGTMFRSKFVGALVAKQALMDAMYGDLGADVTTALSRLAAIASDSILSAGEKGEVIRQYAQVTGEYTGIATQLNALGLTSALTTFNNAYTALGVYLGGLSPAWNDTTSDTPITGATFRSKFNDYYLAREAGRTAIADRNHTDATSALGRLDIIVSDGWLSQVEKPEAVLQVGVLNSEYAGLAAQASALGVTTALTNHATTVNALNVYLATLSPAWNDLTQPTPITGTTFRSKFADAYGTKTALLNAMSAALGAGVDTALGRLDVIVSDGWLSQVEKPEVIRQHATFNGEYAGLSAQAGALGVSMTDHFNAVTALNTYLSSLSPAWDDLTQPTPITGATLRSKVNDAYLSKGVLQNNIAAALRGTGARVPVSRSAAFPVSSSLSTQIDVAAHSVVLVSGEVISIPGGALTGLTASTTYGVFYRSDEGLTCAASPAVTLMSTGARIFLGWQSTPSGGGVFPTPPTPPGGYGGSGVTYQEP
ncbi:hypothetical protein [Brevundimonas sp. TWP2-3-4b1]|uniref:hypothetical protein n=1 Tax=Brevundimonas sp. TWP2-3-4b1 TaxID=2804580 RepID=UPI003CF4984F